MTLDRTTLRVVGVALFGLVGLMDEARAADVPTHVVAADVHEAGIDATRGSNHVWLAADPARRVGKLLVFMGGGGATNLPQDWSEIGSEGGRLGYHTIVLAYANEAPVSALPPIGCGNSVEAPDSPPNCAYNARLEIFDGKGESTVVAVDRANSIENRLTKALQQLAATYPGEGWAKFLATSGAEAAAAWSQIVISGASLGAGEAVLVGMLHSVERVVAFQGWTDAKHGWEAIGMTPSSRYFALSHSARTCSSARASRTWRSGWRRVAHWRASRVRSIPRTRCW